MARTYKDRESLNLPRVPEWARAKPHIRHTGPRPKDAVHDWREEYYDELYRPGQKEDRD